MKTNEGERIKEVKVYIFFILFVFILLLCFPYIQESYNIDLIISSANSTELNENLFQSISSSKYLLKT